jgi:hypothetical protein
MPKVDNILGMRCLIAPQLLTRTQTRSQDQDPYSPRFIFLVTYKWAQEARVLLYYTWLDRLASDKTLVYCGNS